MRVVGQRLQARIHRDRGIGHHQRVAVGRSLRDRVHADDAAAARPVLDHHRLAEPLADQRLDDAREIVGAAARAERNDQPDRPRRIGLREGFARYRAAQPERTAQAAIRRMENPPAAILNAIIAAPAATTHHKVHRATFQCERRRAARLHDRRFHRSVAARRRRLLLLHAAMGHSQRYYAWVPRLCRHYRVVRMDLRGHGESAVPPAEPPLSMERLVQDTRELLDHLGLQERAHRRQFGRRLYRPAARDEFARARDEPDAVRLDAGPEEQPGADLDPARRQGWPAQVPRRHDLGPLSGERRPAPCRMVPRRGGEERHRLHRALRRR